MWLILLLLSGLSGLGGPSEPQTEGTREKLHVQVTVPEKIRSVTSDGYETQVTYNLKIEGKMYTLNLMQKAFLPPSFRVYSYDNSGIMKPLEQKFQNICYFQGHIEVGFLQFGNVSYGIEPLESSSGFEHVIYQVEPKKGDTLLYTEKDIDLRDLQYKIRSIKFEHIGADTAIVTQKIFQLIGLTNAIILSSLEFWMDENKISTTDYRDTTDYVGATYQGKMCDKNYAGGVALHPKAVTLESLAIILVQLLSLSMGIAYDDVSKCQCGVPVCVMNPEALHSSGVRTFSNCSMEDFSKFISSHSSHCLQNQPQLQPSYKMAVCGNGELEEDEVCDCGSEGCADKPPPCCNPTTCKLSEGSACSNGMCCDTTCKSLRLGWGLMRLPVHAGIGQSICFYMAYTRHFRDFSAALLTVTHFTHQLKAKGELCRPATRECDLTEYCNGTSEVCDEDFFVQDGHPCAESKWICINGTCQSGGQQCQDLFGPDADYGTDECFTELNSKSDISGSCGITPTGYKECAPNDRIKKMWVRDGTICGAKKVCLNQECIEDTFLDYDCTPEKCNHHGVCNNKKHCHCEPTYLPPDCKNTDDSWPGGSIDSGNQQRAESIPARPYVTSAYRPKSPRWPFFLIIPFYVVILVLIGMLVKVYAQRKKWRMEDFSSEECVDFTPVFFHN
ncbi:Disintegrin and metalloproteinase domain-containing protein 2 [Apodemus speciosus]|uniref:Disintegrin and metalloproteinase domain-containing protein 2 n=1 Tax=Apodemus speciosus TaxID=105296 RepID=A0ABQ0FID2_APOSI